MSLIHLASVGRLQHHNPGSHPSVSSPYSGDRPVLPLFGLFPSLYSETPWSLEMMDLRGQQARYVRCTSLELTFSTLVSQEALGAMSWPRVGDPLDTNTRERGLACYSSLIYPGGSDVILLSGLLTQAIRGVQEAAAGSWSRQCSGVGRPQR